MKTLIYALAGGGHGTARLASALTSIGLEGGHEVFGMGDGGSCADVPQTLVNSLYRSSTYEIDMTASNGDNRAADAYFDFAPHIHNLAYDDLIRYECEKVIRDGLFRFLEGDGAFFDIGRHLADMWPIIENMGIETRCIHVIRDGRSWVSKMLSLGAFSYYGETHTLETMYPYIHSPVREGKSFQEQCCIAWRDMHEYFFKADKKMIRLMDYRLPDIAEEILRTLLPGPTAGQCYTFTKAMQSTQPQRRHPDFDDAMFWDICGQVMTRAGFVHVIK